MLNQNLSDEQFIQALVQHIENVSEFENRIINLKGLDLRHIAVTKQCAALFGFDKSSDCIGYKFAEMAHEQIVKFAPIFTRQDNEIIATRNSKTYISVMDYATGPHMLKLHKSPVINPSTGNLLGVFCDACPIELHIIPKFIWEHLRHRDPDKTSIVIIDNIIQSLNIDYQFTSIELDVIFFYLLDYSPIEISRIWAEHSYNLKADGNPKTGKNIRDIKNHLAYKLGKPELNQANVFTNFFKKKGFHNYTPLSIFATFMQSKHL